MRELHSEVHQFGRDTGAHQFLLTNAVAAYRRVLAFFAVGQRAVRQRQRQGVLTHQRDDFIVGARWGNPSSPAKADAAEQTGMHSHPATSVWDMVLLVRYAKSSLGTTLPPSPLVRDKWLLRTPARPQLSKTSGTLSSAPVAD